jgi:hypothetical protein
MSLDSAECLEDQRQKQTTQETVVSIASSKRKKFNRHLIEIAKKQPNYLTNPMIMGRWRVKLSELLNFKASIPIFNTVQAMVESFSDITLHRFI